MLKKFIYQEKYILLVCAGLLIGAISTSNPQVKLQAAKSMHNKIHSDTIGLDSLTYLNIIK